MLDTQLEAPHRKLSRSLWTVLRKLCQKRAPAQSQPVHDGLLDTLWLTYARLAEANATCYEEPAFYSMTAAQVRTWERESAQLGNAVPATRIIETIINGIGSTCLHTSSALAIIQGKLTAAYQSRSLVRAQPH
jgi:hypothetical protein